MQPPDSDTLWAEKGFLRNIGVQLFTMLLQDHGQLLANVLSNLSAKDLGRLQCTCQLFRARTKIRKSGRMLSLAEAAARANITQLETHIRAKCPRDFRVEYDSKR